MRSQSRYLKEFVKDEKSGGLVLLFCAVFSLLATNVFFPGWYGKIWFVEIAGMSISEWINDVLMAVFFLLIGLELKREILGGELSTWKKAILPVIAALGGMLLPFIIYTAINIGSGSIRGAGIPIATDIAFSLGVLSLFGKRVPFALKIFLTALAVADDLGAIVVIAIFYTQQIHFLYILGVIAVSLLLFASSRLKFNNPVIYILGGILIWLCMYHSGVHSTLAGVILAFLIPTSPDPHKSLSHKFEHKLNIPVAFIILPLFALANTSIYINSQMFSNFISPNTLGIILGLLIGKPLGIFFFSLLSVKLKICHLPAGVKFKQIFGVSILGGIGFTMSIFIAILSFEHSITLDYSKIAVLIGSLLSGILGYLWLSFSLKK
jgi:NhaA family Na+:H+ antiporter